MAHGILISTTQIMLENVELPVPADLFALIPIKTAEPIATAKSRLTAVVFPEAKAKVPKTAGVPAGSLNTSKL
jgi:hypothetical protein